MRKSESIGSVIGSPVVSGHSDPVVGISAFIKQLKLAEHRCFALHKMLQYVMQKEFSYTVGGVTYRGKAEQADRPWGNGLNIETFDAQGNLRDWIGFASHPEFDEFDELQSKTADELLAIAIDVLNSGKYESSLQDARQHGIKLLLRLNGVNQ